MKKIPTLPENKEEVQPYTIILRPDNTEEVILKKLNTLKQLQKVVGGYIEQIDCEYKGRKVQMRKVSCKIYLKISTLRNFMAAEHPFMEMLFCSSIMN